MSLAIGLSASSFFLPSQLTYLFHQNINLSHDQQNINEKQLNQAKALELPAFYQYQRHINQIGSKNWLRASRGLAKSNSAIARELGNYYQQNENFKQARLWYLQGIKLGDDSARVSLAALLIAKNKYSQALKLLQPISKNNDALLLLTKIAIYQGDSAKINLQVPLLNQFDSGQKLVREMTKYKVYDKFSKSLTQTNFFNQNKTKSCIANIQMFATNLADLNYLEQQILQFETHSLSKYLCFNNIRYISLAETQCHHKNQDTIRCNETIWREKANSFTARYIGLLLPNGGANVNSGIMYLDNKDTVDVLAHEVSHLLGFVDEYPLPLNHAKCATQQADQFSHNIAVLTSNYSGSRNEVREKVLTQIPWRRFIDEETPIMTFENGFWRLGTPSEFHDKVGLFLSDTCGRKLNESDEEITEFSSFKPLNTQTQLTYFELKFPLLYQNILKRNPRQFLMPSFFYNIEAGLDMESYTEKDH